MNIMTDIKLPEFKEFRKLKELSSIVAFNLTEKTRLYKDIWTEEEIELNTHLSNLCSEVSIIIDKIVNKEIRILLLKTIEELEFFL